LLFDQQRGQTLVDASLTVEVRPVEPLETQKAASGSLLYGKTLNPPRNAGVILGKSSSLMFPANVDAPGVTGGDSESTNLKRRKRFPLKRKMNLMTCI
jgi:hypothetical protein